MSLQSVEMKPTGNVEMFKVSIGLFKLETNSMRPFTNRNSKINSFTFNKKNPRLTRKPTLVEFKPRTHPSSIPLKTATRKPSLFVKPTINTSLAPVIRNILTFKPSPVHTLSENQIVK